jgi:hypothetical protein
MDDTDVAAVDVVASPQRRWPVVVVAALSCASALFFGVGARDDPYITFWVAEQLAKTGHLVNINGAPVEQSSSLAHVLVLAALYFVTRAPMPVLAYAAGLVALFATVQLSASLAGRLRPGTQLPAACLVGLAFPIVYWATGELETDLAAAAVLSFVVSLHALLVDPQLPTRTLVGFAASTVFVVTVRPDCLIVAFLVTVLVLGLAALGPTRGGRVAALAPEVELRRAAIATGTVAGAIGLLCVFREVVFHQVLPQPEIVKAGGLNWFPRGFSYVATSFPWWMWLAFLALLVLGVRWSVANRSLAGVLAAASFALGVVLLCFSRGDWMGGARLLVPYLAPGLVVMAAGAWSLRRVARSVAVALLVGIECVTFVMFANGVPWLSSQYETLTPAQATSSAADYGSFLGGSWTSSVVDPPSIPWYADWSFITTRDTLFLAAATPELRSILERVPPGQKVTIASNQAGMIFYTWANEFPGRLKFIDLQSLATNDFSRCPGRFASYAGDFMTLTRWAADVGHCAPPLADLYFSPSGTTSLTRYYNVRSFMWIKYERRGITETRPLYGTELLAQRKGWSP